MSETVLFPQGPLLIVDRGMRKKMLKGQSYDTCMVDEKDVKISMFQQDTSKDAPRPVAHTRRISPPARTSNVRFVDPAQAKRKPYKSRKKSTPLAKAASSHQEVALPNSERTEHSLALCRASSLTSSTTAFYGTVHGLDPESLSFLPHYLDVSTYYYPLQHVLRLEFDPVPTDYLPEGLIDECCLSAILYTTVGRLELRKSQLSAARTELYQETISRLRKRVATGDVGDHTVCAIVMLAFYEYYRKDQSRDTKAHFQGINQAVLACGGLDSFHPKIQTKILKVLLIQAVDTLTRPSIELPVRLRSTLARSLDIAPTDISVKRIKSLSNNFQPVLQETLLDLLELATAINSAIDNGYRVHPYSLDEDILTLQHKMLCLSEYECSNLENSCRLAILVFTKVLIRKTPFASTHCSIIAAAMKRAYTLTQHEVQQPETRDLRLWILFMATLIARNTEHRFWFCPEMASLALTLDVPTEEALLSHLKTVIWIPGIFDHHVYTMRALPGCAEDYNS